MDILNRIGGFPVEKPTEWTKVHAGAPCFRREVKDAEGNLKKVEEIAIVDPQAYKLTAFLDTNKVYEVRNNLATKKTTIKRFDLDRDFFDKNGGIFKKEGTSTEEYIKLTKEEFKKLKGKSLAQVASEFIDAKADIQQQIDDLIKLAQDTKNFTKRIRWVK